MVDEYTDEVPFVTPIYKSREIVTDPLREEAINRALQSPEWQAYVKQVEADFLFGRRRLAGRSG